MKKLLVILVSVLIVMLMVVKLISNKQKIDKNLKLMQQYTSVVPVQVTNPFVEDVTARVTSTGVLKAGAEVSIISETSGSVLSVMVKVGDVVRAGQLLAKVDKELLESQIPLAKLTLENTEKDLKRYTALVETDAVTQQQLESAKSAYQSAQANYASLSDQLTKKEIRAPVSGIVSSRLIEKGTSIIPSMDLFTIVEKDRMKFTVSLTETEIAAVNTGNRVGLRFDALPGKDFEGKVLTTGVLPDQGGRYCVDVDVENRSYEFRAGMSGEATFTLNLQNEAMLLHRKCIIGSIKDAKVFVIERDSVIERPVTVQALNDSSVIVLKGLLINEEVVYSGQMNLRNGTKVRILNKGNTKKISD